MKIEGARRYEIKISGLSEFEVLALTRACNEYSNCVTNDEAESMKKIADSLENIL